MAPRTEMPRPKSSQIGQKIRPPIMIFARMDDADSFLGTHTRNFEYGHQEGMARAILFL